MKIRDEGLVRNKAVYLAIGMDADGCKHVLGMWIEQTEGAKFWLRVMNELKSRGAEADRSRAWTPLFARQCETKATSRTIRRRGS